MAKNQIGNIYEIETGKGKVYLHFVHYNEIMGDLVRVLPGFYEKQPDSLEELAAKKEQFVLFFQVTYGSRIKMVKKVGKVSLEGFEPPKYMRTEAFGHGREDGWFIVNLCTFNREYVDVLMEEQKTLSPYSIWSHPVLVERLENGFSLNDWI